MGLVPKYDIGDKVMLIHDGRLFGIVYAKSYDFLRKCAKYEIVWDNQIMGILDGWYYEVDLTTNKELDRINKINKVL